MKEKRGLYPDKSVYAQQIGPGLCFGALALMLRFFFEVPRRGAGGAAAVRARPPGPVRGWGAARQRPRVCAWGGGEPAGGAEAAAEGPRLCPAGVGPRLRAQLLPLRPGPVLRPAAAQGQQEGWRRGGPGQAGLLHPVLRLHLTCTLHRPPPAPVPSPVPHWRQGGGGGPSCPSSAQSVQEKVCPHILTGPGALGSARHAKCFPGTQLLSIRWVLGAGRRDGATIRALPGLGAD